MLAVFLIRRNIELKNLNQTNFLKTSPREKLKADYYLASVNSVIRLEVVVEMQ